MTVKVAIATKKKQKQLNFNAEYQVPFHIDAVQVWRLLMYLHSVSKLS
jgi:hypothetical protein